jgi:predicted DNA-binding protein
MNGSKSGGRERNRTISFNLTLEQLEKVVKLREHLDITTGEVIRRACEACTEELLRRNPAPNYIHHLTVSLPEDLRNKVSALADACDMKISDVIRRACEAYFEKVLGKAAANTAGNTLAEHHPEKSFKQSAGDAQAKNALRSSEMSSGTV